MKIGYKKKVKESLVSAFGRKCQRCKQEFPSFVFDFHHINPETKNFGIGDANVSLKQDALFEEVKKCIMLCANCHRFIHQGEEVQLLCNFDESLYLETWNTFYYNNPNQVFGEVVPRQMPSRDILKQDIRSMPFIKVGLKYSVSDNAIRKWCKKLNLPRTSKEIKSISDNEWGQL